MKNKKRAFTLAEVLITLAIIGVVAAITIPTLIAKINTITTKNQIKIIENKFEQGVNLYKNLDNGFNGSYTTTYQFLEGLSKHFKITAMCDTNEIEKCFPYPSISYLKYDNSIEKIDISTIKTPDKLIKVKSTDWLPPASFITAAGIPYIITIKKNCIIDPDSIDTEKENAMSCIDGIYDYSGAKSPNQFGKDVTPISAASIGCALSVENTCFTTKPFKPKPISYSECEALKNEYGIPHCYNFTTDYWAGAIVQCGGINNLPTWGDLLRLATQMYKNSTYVNGNFWYKDHTKPEERVFDKNSAVAEYLNLEIPFRIWTSGYENTYKHGTYSVKFLQDTAGGSYDYRNDSSNYAMCIAN